VFRQLATTCDRGYILHEGVIGSVAVPCVAHSETVVLSNEAVSPGHSDVNGRRHVGVLLLRGVGELVRVSETGMLVVSGG
jgi:hypothetical protein